MRCMTETIRVKTPADFASIIEEIVTPDSKSPLIITLVGDLGAGKTTFTQQLAIYLGITEPVTSPTFGIMKSYEIENNPVFDELVHMDTYRIEDISEAKPLRIEELLHRPKTLICIEWPERIAEIVPKQRTEVSIRITKNEEREVSVAREEV